MIKGRFEVKFATTVEELDEVYKLRYEDLVLEYDDTQSAPNGRDISDYDRYAKHLIVKDINTGEVCGYYRMITSDALRGSDKFVCEEEFDIDGLKATGEKICEFSRAVIKKQYRGGVVLLLLWKFILDYMAENNYRFMVGDASFKGTDREQYREEISYLINNYCADASFNILTRDTLPPMIISDTTDVCANEVLRKLPPLIRAYVAVGAKVASQPFTDVRFGSVDVFILVDMKNCNEAYVRKLRGV